MPVSRWSLDTTSAQLEEALIIAREPGINDRESGISNQQSVILSEDETMHSKNPIYLYGTRALSAEIKALQNSVGLSLGMSHVNSPLVLVFPAYLHWKDSNYG